MKRRFFSTLEHITFGSVSITTPEGKCYTFSGKENGAHGTISIHDWRTISLLVTKGDIGFAEAYRNGWWDSEDLLNLLVFGLQNQEVLDGYIYGGWLTQLTSKFLYFFNTNTLHGSKRNIHKHYDLGNDFYSLWLDPGMSYSAALFSDINESLEQAQYNKYDRILSRLSHPSGSILEIGCGWGGFAERAVTQHDYTLKGITLSEEQYRFAKTRLDKNANIAIEDYRKQEGKYDHIVSIEMFEAVGEKFWPVYFGKLNALLNQKGKALIQTITIGEPYFERYRKGGDMIRSYIFPGGMLPSLTRFKQEANNAGLQVTDSFTFGLDYAKTLEHWLSNFEAKLPEVRKLGFDESFIRLWRLYLSVCIASFRLGRTNVAQLELQHA